MKTEATSTLIALVGGSGAGKSWLSKRLRQELGDEAMSLSLDDFYRDRSSVKQSERSQINFDHPEAIDWPIFESVLRDLRDGVPASAPRYSFVSHTRLTEWRQTTPQPFILVEGLWLLWPARVRKVFDLRVFIDCTESLRWERRLARDLGERGRSADSIHEQFWKTVAPMHERFVEVQKAWADLVLQQPISVAGLGRLVATIQALRTGPPPAQPEITHLRKPTPQFSAFQSL